MATIEKPKKEKTKKYKAKRTNDSLTEIDNQENIEDVQESEVEAILKEQSKRNFEQFEVIASTSNANIISQECAVSSDCQTSNDNENLDNKQQSDKFIVKKSDSNEVNVQETISLHEELAQANALVAQLEEILPTAPPVDNSNIRTLTTLVEQSQVIQYPTLQSLQNAEAEAVITYQPPKIKSPGFRLTESTLEPLTAEQLKQIYYCKELDLVKQFELEFLTNSLLETQESDPLYAALLEYHALQTKLTNNQHEIERIRKEAQENEVNIWIKQPITKTYRAKCGCNEWVQESVTYDITKVDGKNLENASATLSKLFELLCYTFTTNQITAQVTKVKIDEIINRTILYPEASRYTENGRITLQKTLNADALQCMAQLRRAISIVFSFIRKTSPNEKFDADLKQWLSKLVSLHLLLATREDHWFLLFNILRCPNGVHTWATPFVQVPCSFPNTTTVNNRANELPLPIDSAEINNCVAVLQILLFPIAKRNEYLKAFTQSHKEITDTVRTERWILIDSDGEDSHTASGECIGLKESDLISLLNQIPFERLFSSALKIEKFLEDYIIEADMISAEQMIQVIAFFSKLTEILGEGMLTYNTERYKQLAKRVGRLMRHTLQYVFDYHDLFIHNNLFKDTNSYERIAVELNVLLVKACSYIYRTRNLATWQYFSSLPFSNLETETVWQLFYYLNIGFPNEFDRPRKDYLELFNAPDFWKNFNTINADVSAEDMYYLLQTFFEMANERDKVKDWELIRAICVHIFYIGFINEPTRDICYKTARDMLLNLTLAYEDLMSCILLQLKIRFSETENVPFLCKSLPLENWKPNMDSFEILSAWLLHYDFKTPESMVARIIISHLNWGYDCDGRLFLPHNIHVRMACLISEALNKHAPEVIGVSTLTESVRQVTSLLDFSHATKEHFTNWCWSMVSVLRLHLMDQSKDARKKTLSNPIEPLMFVPDLERIDAIYQGVTENRPLAIYVALLVSLHGHSIPLICQKGFDLMKLLLNHYRHAAVIRSLEVIVPLFLESSDTLAACEKFHVVLNNLLNADKTYLKMAKDVIYPNAVGPVLELFDNMLHHQITSYMDYGLSSPLNLIYVWLNCFTALPNWQNSNVVYLLDRLLRIAYQFSDAWTQSVGFFLNYYKECDEWKGTNKSSIKTFFGANQTRIPALSSNFAWLSLLLLEIEFQMQDSQFWPELLRQMSAQNCGKPNLETCLKKTSSLAKFANFSPNLLVIYKYANLISTMDIAHALFPIMNQKFFEIYLSRVPLHYDESSFEESCGVADKFYEYNVPLMKKIKSNLKAADTYYTSESTKHANDEAMSYFYRNCARMMKAFELWLEETSINRFSGETKIFPPQYNNEKLQEILKGNTRHWTEFIFLPAIRKEQRYQAEQWARKCFRHRSHKNANSPLQTKTKKTAIERIKMHLRSYDDCMEPPKYVVPSVMLYKEISKSTLKELKNELKILTSAAIKCNNQTSELNALNRSFLEFIIGLYKMSPVRNIKYKNCNYLSFARKCTSPANIETIVEVVVRDEVVQRKVETYHDRHDKIVDDLLVWKLEKFAQCIEGVGCTIRTLLSTLNSNNAQSVSLTTKTGIEFFYHIIENMTDVTMKFQPTNDCLTQLLNELGIFIQNNQEEHGLKILDLTLKRPDLLKVLAAVFVPYRTRPEHFIKMYKFLIDSHLQRCDTKIIFVLFSKFDLESWLENSNPKLHEIEELLKLVLQGLETWSQPNSAILQDQFRRHLTHIFKHNFPEHYGEVLQKVLLRISEQQLMPVVLLDLLNVLCQRANCASFDLSYTSDEQIRTLSMDFSCSQKLFNFQATNDTIMLFARHFQKERLSHGLHGLYPKHKSYCKPLTMWLSCLGHMLCATSICTYQHLLADQICDIIFGSIAELYAPWLITYTEQTMQQAPSNWIQKLTENGQMLLPWSAQHVQTSKSIIKSFINTLQYVLDTLPASRKILGHTFGWYIYHFTIPNLESHIFPPIHEGLATLPWDLFIPQANNIDLLYESLQKFTPEAHAMLGHIFIRIDWKTWFSDVFPCFSEQDKQRIISRLFTVFVKIAFEPNIHLHPNTSKILEDAINYPWHLVDITEIENLLKWFVTAVDPTIILNIPNETNYADRAVLDLIRFSCAMMPNRVTALPISQDTARRLLYVRAYIRLLRTCASKNQKLLATKEGKRSFGNSLQNLLNFMNNAINVSTGVKSASEQQREAINMMVEIVEPMSTQSLETSDLIIDTIVDWQYRANAGNFLVLGTLSAVGHMRAFIAGTYKLFEVSLINYFRTSVESATWHCPTWSNLLRLLHMSLDKLQMMPIVSGTYYLTLHIFILYKLERIQNSGDQITFIQDLVQLVETMKTTPQTEAHLAIVWGLVISRGCKLLSTSEHAKKPLLMFARSLYVVSTQSEGWGDGLLGAIGLKRDSVTNKRKILSRSLACVLFSLFPEPSSQGQRTNQEFENSVQELTYLLANKKFSDVKPLIVKVTGIIKENKFPELRDVPHLVCRLIALVYNDAFLTTIPEVWEFDFKL